MRKDEDCDASIDFDLGLKLTFRMEGERKRDEVKVATGGRRLFVLAESKCQGEIERYQWNLIPPVPYVSTGNEIELVVPVGLSQLRVEVVAIEKEDSGVVVAISEEIPVRDPEVVTVGGNIDLRGRVAIQESVGVRLLRTASDPTLDQALWVAIRNRTRAISFGRYQEFMNKALLWQEGTYDFPIGVQDPASQERIKRDLGELGIHLHGVRAYHTLKLLTETFLLLECGVRIERQGQPRVPFDFGEETRRLGEPFTLEVMEERLGPISERTARNSHTLPALSGRPSQRWSAEVGKGV